MQAHIADLFLLRRYFTEDTVDPIAIVAGLVQTALFSDFFYIYFTKSVPPLSSLRAAH